MLCRIRKAGEKANSAAVIANAWQHRADVFISSAVLVGLLGSVAGYPFMDPAAGLLVSGFIVKQVYLTSIDTTLIAFIHDLFCLL